MPSTAGSLAAPTCANKTVPRPKRARRHSCIPPVLQHVNKQWSVRLPRISPLLMPGPSIIVLLSSAFLHRKP